MSETLTIRLSDEARQILAAAAEARSMGISAFVRDIAEGEAWKLHQLAIRDEMSKMMARVGGDEPALAELEATSHPDWQDIPE